MKTKCPCCGREDECRPYTDDGSPICFSCAMGSSEREATAELAFMRLLGEAHRVTGAAMLTEDGPIPYVGPLPHAARAESESPTPDMNQERGIWRCEACGEALPESCIDPDWRWAGDRWQHAHGQAGHIDARYFANSES